MEAVSCPYCNSRNTEIEIDESISEDGDETIHIQAQCNNCLRLFDFPEELDWREYV